MSVAGSRSDRQHDDKDEAALDVEVRMDAAAADARGVTERSGAVAEHLARVRVQGEARVEFGRRAGATHVIESCERDGYRVRFPIDRAVFQAVVLNTGGGLVGGDRADLAFVARGGAAAEVTTQTAERVYRSIGPAAAVDITLGVGPQARLAWLPQETILYSGARLVRRISADVSGDGHLLIVEMMVYGRAAMGETVEAGHLEDQWRIRRDGRLVFAEAVRLDGPLRALMDRAAIGDGARAAATILLVSPHAGDLTEGARTALGTTRGLAAVGSWNGLLSARFLGHRAEDVRADVARLAAWLNGGSMPRAWSI